MNKYLLLALLFLFNADLAFGASKPISVTAATPNIVVSPSPCVGGACTIGATDLINAQGSSASYTVVAADMGKTVTHNLSTAIAETLPQAGTTGFLAGVSYSEFNLGAGTETITPTTSTINGASTLLLHKGGFAYGVSDGANWQALSFPGFGTITSSALTKFIDGSGAITAATAGTDYQVPITLTTTGTSGAATFSSGTLNIPQYSGGGGGVTWPATGDIVVSNTTNTPAGLVEVDGDCVVGTSGNWVAGSCSGSASANLGTSLSATSPQITGDATSGLYTAGAAKVDVGISGAKVVEVTASGEAVTGTTSSTLAVGANGSTNPVLAVDASTTSVASGVVIKGAATGVAPTITTTDSGTNSGLTVQTKGTGTLTLNAGSGGVGAVNIQSNSSTVFSYNTSKFAWTPASMTGSTNAFYNFGMNAKNTSTASTEGPFMVFGATGNFDQHATGALSLQRDYIFVPYTDSFAGASTLTDGATIGFSLPGCGTNATCTNMSGIYHASTALTTTGPITNSFALNIAADSGATNNYAARFAGDIELVGAAPTISSCGSGTIVTGSSDHKGSVTGVTAATACTITFAQAFLTPPSCTFSSNAAIVPTISTISTSAVTTTMTALTGTLYYLCF